MSLKLHVGAADRHPSQETITGPQRAQATFKVWLARTGSPRLAASAAGISERTGRRWKNALETPHHITTTIAHNLSSPLDEGVPRTPELEQLTNALSRGIRLISVVGPPGVGKSRLVQEFGWSVVRRYQRLGGVWWCSLENRTSLDDMFDAICGALRESLPFSQSQRSTLEHVGRLLEARGPLLLILDGVEQLIESAQSCISFWLQRAPETTIILTSSIASELKGEHVITLAPLDTEVEGLTDTLPCTPAAALFLLRARERTSLSEDPSTLKHIEALVRRLDGLPLAIELAAARANLMSPADILRRLDEPWSILRRSQSTVHRHDTMLATLEWSWALLSPTLQETLMQCALFNGGFALQDAEAILSGAPKRQTEPLLDQLQQLMGHSLLRREGSAETRTAEDARLGMYELVQKFVRTKLSSWPGCAAAELRHAQHYLTRFERDGADQDVRGERQTLDRLRRDLPNALEAFERALQSRLGPESASLAVRYVIAMNHVLNAFDSIWHRMAVRALSDDILLTLPLPLRSRALSTRGCLTYDRAARTKDLCQALELSRQTHDSSREGVILRNQLMRGALPAGADAEQCYQQSWALACTSGDLAEQIRVLHAGAFYALNSGELEKVRAFTRLWRQRQPSNDSTRHAFLLIFEGSLALSEERGDEAIGLFEQAATMFRQQGHHGHELEALIFLGTAYLESGYVPRAMTLLGHIQRESERAALLRVTALSSVLSAAGHYFQNAPDACTSRLQGVREQLKHFGDWWGEEYLVLIFLCAAACAQDHPSEAARLLEQARALESGASSGWLKLAVSVCEGHIGILNLRAALRSGDADQTAALRLEVEQMLASVVAKYGPFSRLIVLSVRHALAQAGIRGTSSQPALFVSADAGRLTLPDGQVIDLSGRGPLRRIMLQLVESHQRTPGSPCSSEELFSGGWPGEKAIPEAVVNRVRVALSTLRSLGLRSFLTTQAGGYCLTPTTSLKLGGTDRSG